MLWVFVFGGIGLAGLIVLIGYIVWLSHKASDVFAELRVVFDRLGQLSELLAQIRVPDPGAGRETIEADADGDLVAAHPIRFSAPKR